jgi:1-phosphofructokinase family hexose kinase
MIVCVAANPAIDKLFEVERLAPGEIHRPVALVARPGGKGLNAARAAAALGAAVEVTGLVGGHAGEWLQEALMAEPLTGRFVRTAAETRSCLSVADRETGGLTEFYEDAAPVTREEWDELVDLVESLLVPSEGPASCLALSGSLPPGAPADGYATLIGLARDAGVPTALDSRGGFLSRAIVASPTLVKINAAEAAELIGARIADAADAVATARAIRTRTGGDGHAVAITLGEAGAVLVDPAGRAWRGTLDVRGAYPVSSGDAFLAGLVVALERSAAWSDAARLALGAAAASAELPGAGVLDGDRAQALARAAVVGGISG